MIKPTKEFLEVFKKTNGALSVCESIAIMNIAAQAPHNDIALECGVYHGKSAMSAAVSLNVEMFVLCDVLFDEVKYDDAEKTEKVVTDNVWDANANTIILISDCESLIEIPRRANYSYVFVDSGSHQDGLPMQEVKLLEDRMVQGGIIAFHDFRSQFVEVEGAYMYLLSTGKYEEIDINWREIIEYVKENDLEKGNTSWHHNELEFPCFVGALKRK